MIRKEDKLSGTYTRYDYTSENQLIRVSEFPTLLSTTPTKETNYYFDALNRRMAKVSTDFVDSNNSFTRKYIYDGEEIIAEFDESNNLLARYTHSSLRTDDVLAMDVTASGVTRNVASVAGSYYYLKDHLGTIKHVTNSIGDIVQTINYSAFGVITSIKDVLGNDISSNPLVQVFHSFTGREFDRETGLYFYRARFYDSSTGRFLQQDPDPGKIDNPITTINRYSYVANNPLQNIDPSGRIFGLLTGYGSILGSIFGTGELQEFSQLLLSIQVAGASLATGDILGLSREVLASNLIVSFSSAALTNNGSFGERFLRNTLLGLAGAKSLSETFSFLALDPSPKAVIDFTINAVSIKYFGDQVCSAENGNASPSTCEIFDDEFFRFASAILLTPAE